MSIKNSIHIKNFHFTDKFPFQFASLPHTLLTLSHNKGNIVFIFVAVVVVVNIVNTPPFTFELIRIIIKTLSHSIDNVHCYNVYNDA